MVKLIDSTKSCRLYRRAKYTAPSGSNPGKVGSGSNYGSGQTTNITYIEIYISGGTVINIDSVTVSPTTLSVEVGQSSTLTETVFPDSATNKSVTWSSSDASTASVNNGIVTGVREGTATITVTSVADATKSATCEVTVTPSSTPTVPVTGVTISPTTASLNVGETQTLTATVSPDSATNKAVTWSSDNTAVATISNGVITAVAAGTATITVTTVDGGKTASCTVAVSAVPTPIPQTDLTLHVPEIYEQPEIAGGYGGTLSVVGGREFEVYYINRDENNLSVSTTTTDRTGNITTSSSQTQAAAKDGWFFIKGVGSGNAENVTASNEFSGGWRRVNLKDNKDTIQLHVQGFDQFSIYAKDASEGSSARQHIAVFIDGEEKSMTYNKAFTVRRFDCTSSEHVITVTAVGNSTNQVTAFSFRLAQEPRTKWVEGNDSTQAIRQTEAPKPVYYFTKHNSLGETRLEWDGLEANGITLSPAGSNPLGDTLVLGGQANCATGVYNYHVIAYKNGTETNRVSGKFTVKSEIKATTDTIISVRQNATMKEIKFRYYALGPNNVHLTWTTAATPNGISGRGNNGTFTISGSTSSPEGDYPFTVSVDGGNSVNGLIKVKSSDLGKDPILFLCSKEAHAESDIVYTYLHQLTGEKKKNLDVLEANSAPREPEEYAPYKWIIISEDVDANNPEILAIIKGGVASNKPVLNLKGFTYWSDRLDWGNTVNGTVDTTIHQENCKIYVQRDDHPIFKGWRNKDIKILDAAKGKQGFMPIEVTNSVLKQSLCLATAYTRNLDDYYENGDLQMVVHEIPASMRGAKYICLSLAGNRALSTDGKELIDRIVNYLTSETPTDITAPKLEITQFSINGTDGIIDPLSDTIKVTFMNQEVDLTALKPVVTLADSKYTFFTPRLKNDETVDFSNSTFKPVDFVVSDYISRRTYHVVVVSKSSQDIEEVYEAGQWVNIFDIFGRKIATTNENIYTMDLPRGMYIVVTESGQTLKIMR